MFKNKKDIIKKAFGLLTGFLIFEVLMYLFWPDSFILTEGNENRWTIYFILFITISGGLSYSLKKAADVKGNNNVNLK